MRPGFFAFTCIRIFFCATALIFTPRAGRAEPSSSVVSGRVLDAETSQPLAEASVRSEGRTGVVDREGSFTLSGLAPGHHRLTISAPSHETLDTEMNLTAGTNALPPVLLAKEIIQIERVVVSERASDASGAFAGKAADIAAVDTIAGKALERPSAQSASDLLKDTAGVSVTRGADGGTTVSMRGLDSRFVRVTVDGQRQGGGRNPLDSLPPEIVKSLQVSKSLTPDQDADALGGAINVTTQNADEIKAAYWQGRELFTYAPLMPRVGVRSSITFGRPVRWRGTKPNGGFIATLNYDDQYRRRENNETDGDWPDIVSPGPAPFTGVPVPAYTRARLEITDDHRRRATALFNADARFGDLRIFLRANLTHDESTRTRRRMRFDVAEGVPVELTPERGVFSGVHLERREQEQTAIRDSATFSLGGETLRGRTKLDGAVGLVLTHEEEPHTLDAVFRSDRTFRTTYDARTDALRPQFSFVDETNPADTTSQLDPAHYFFNSYSRTQADTRDREWSARLNAQFNLDDSPAPAFAKLGAKIQ